MKKSMHKIKWMPLPATSYKFHSCWLPDSNESRRLQRRDLLQTKSFPKQRGWILMSLGMREAS